MADKIVTIANFLEPFEAELARIKLEAEGIRCFLAGKNFVSTYWLYSNADHGIKLQVNDRDAVKAVEILENNDGAELEEIHDEELIAEPAEIVCPKCKSENIEYERFSRTVALLSVLFLRFPLPFPKRTYKCQDCGYTWK